MESHQLLMERDGEGTYTPREMYDAVSAPRYVLSCTCGEWTGSCLDTKTWSLEIMAWEAWAMHLRTLVYNGATLTVVSA